MYKRYLVNEIKKMCDIISENDRTLKSYQLQNNIEHKTYTHGILSYIRTYVGRCILLVNMKMNKKKLTHIFNTLKRCIEIQESFINNK